MTNNKVAIISLGCDKNRVDTETILFYLYKGGFQITTDYEQANIIIINTCAFISSAVKESIDTIFEYNHYRKNSLSKLIVCGCLPQRHKDNLIELLPEVDAFVGINDYSNICSIINEETTYSVSPHKVCETIGRIQTTPAHYSYLKIAEGCDNKCTYCTIPSLRGYYRSTDMQKLIEEAKMLESRGVEEVMIVAQDTTRYGSDLYGKNSFVELLNNIISNTTYIKLRLLYCYPEFVSNELIDCIKNNDRIYNYIDIPLQHISDKVLKRMGRKSNKDAIINLFKKLNSSDIKVRTTFMVGFPGETEDDFAQLCEFVKEYKPHHVGIFAYSKEEGAPSAKLKETLTKKDKNVRVKILGKLHKENVCARNENLIGKTIKVLYEDIDYDKNMFVGRTEYDAPEIDGYVYFYGNNCEVGNTYEVKITDYKDYDLKGEQVYESSK